MTKQVQVSARYLAFLEAYVETRRREEEDQGVPVKECVDYYLGLEFPEFTKPKRLQEDDGDI